MPPVAEVQELRLVLTVSDFAEGVDGGRATLELVNACQADAIDEAEVGRRIAGPVRIAFQVPDREAAAARPVDSGATHLTGAVTTPWNDHNVRVSVTDGMQLTLFTTLE